MTPVYDEVRRRSVYKNIQLIIRSNKMLSYRRENALQGTLLLTESGRLELGDNILLTLYVCLQPLGHNRQQRQSIVTPPSE